MTVNLEQTYVYAQEKIGKPEFVDLQYFMLETE